MMNYNIDSATAFCHWYGSLVQRDLSAVLRITSCGSRIEFRCDAFTKNEIPPKQFSFDVDLDTTQPSARANRLRF